MLGIQYRGVSDQNYFSSYWRKGHRASNRAGMCDDIIPKAVPWEKIDEREKRSVQNVLKHTK